MGTSRINILQVSSSKVFGGAEEHLRTLVKYLDKKSFDVAIAVPGGGCADVLMEEKMRVIPYEVHCKYDIKAVFKLKKIIKEEKTDIVHSHDRRADLMSSVAARLAGVKVVTTIHDKINMNERGERSRCLSSSMYRFILRNGFEKIITVSEATKRDVIQQTKCSSDKVIHIQNGMDLEKLDFASDKDALRTALGIEKNKKIVGLVARLRKDYFEKKGIIYFIEAAASVLKKFNNVKFIIAGMDEEAEEKLQEITHRFGVQPYFCFVRYRRAVIEIISLFDVIVLPSLFEGLPRSLMEGMALGIPAVGTSIDGISELIDDGRRGLLVGPKNSEELAAAILKLLTDENLAAALSEAGRKRIFEHFDGRIMAKETGALYSSIIG